MICSTSWSADCFDVLKRDASHERTKPMLSIQLNMNAAHILGGTHNVC
jgi:hypothetical protein